MNVAIKNENESQTRNSIRRIFRVAILLILVCVFAIYIYYVLIWKSESEKASEKMIREAAAAQLNKNPNQLSKEDFAKITDLELTFVTYPEIKLLRKFVNLQHLHISRDYPDSNPWLPNPADETSNILVLINKLGIKYVPRKKYIDLNPLKKLSKLETLYIGLTVNNIKPLAYLSNLEVLEFSGGTSSYNLQGKFVIEREYLDVKPLGKLSNLKKLSLASYSIQNTEAIAKLKNLKKLHLLKKLPPEENRYLQRTLPDLKIIVSTRGGTIQHDDSHSELLFISQNETKYE